jgi:dynein heavy chain 1, cytosolic
MVLAPRNPQKRLILLLDEVNLPKPDAYGTQRAIALTRQLVEQRGFWRVNPDGTESFISLQRIQLAFACNPPTDAGRVPLPPRFLRHAPLLFIDSPTVDSLKQEAQQPPLPPQRPWLPAGGTSRAAGLRIRSAPDVADVTDVTWPM